MTKTQKRYDYISEKLLTEGYVQVQTLAAELETSPTTIRKDLLVLQSHGLLRRTHGGAIPVRELTYEIEHFYKNRAAKNLREKQQIGRVAAQLIQANAVIAFSGGSTPLQIAMQLQHDDPFTAITNDLNIVHTLSQHEHIEIFVPGGYLRMGKDTLVGTHALNALKGFDIDIVFLTVTALDIELGATAGHIGNVLFLRKLVEQSKRCIVVADHDKFENPSQIVICGWDAIDMLITDAGISESIHEQLDKKDITVIIA